MSFDAIAKELGCSKGAAREIYYRAMRKIRRDTSLPLPQIKQLLGELKTLREQRESESA